MAYSNIADVGGVLGIAGLMTSAVGNYYALKSQQYQLRSQALSLEYEQSMSALNARNAELDAQSILEAGEREHGQLTQQYGQAKASARVSQAASGVQAGVGSAAEVQASIDYAKEADTFAIDMNTLRAANARRTQAVDLQNRAALAGVSAANVRGAAGSINPFLGSAASLLGGAGQVAQSWAYSKRPR